MTLPASGQITLNQVNVELGNSGTAQIGMNDAAVRALFGIPSGEIEMSDGYGKSSETVLTSAGTVNGQDQRQQITVSDFISSGGTLRVPSNIWVWSDSRSTAAMVIDISCTIVNEGKIIGRGGDGGGNPWWGSSAGQSGGPAIKINSGVTGVTITNSSGAYIAGGGGGGGPGSNPSSPGGGAGGGSGSRPGESGSTVPLAAGGALNATGSTGLAYYYPNTVTPGAGNSGAGGGAGGGGGHYVYSGGDVGFSSGGGGGGRILPGTGGSGGTSSGGGQGGAGGSAGNAGTASTFYGSGGGGGWGASGGSGSGGTSGGAGGAAIDDSGETYTLSNSGTIYGGT
jgi:hypothetical protein